MNLSIKRLELILWMLTPASICVILFILCTIPKHIWGISYIVPVLPLLPIFYWGRLQTAEMPYWFVAFIGLLTDVINATPLGMSSLLYLMFIIVLHAQSKYIRKEGFAILWVYFILLLALVAVSQWVVMSLLSTRLYAFTPALMQWFFTACFYPLFHALFDRVAEFIKQRRWIATHG